MSAASFQPIHTTQIISRRALAYVKEHKENLQSKTCKQLEAIKLKRGGDIKSGTQSVKYAPTLKSPAGKLGYGRLYATGGPSLERMENQVRATLCGEYYYDVDIVNAQPTICVQYAKARYGRELTALADYVANRDQRLADISESRDEAKEMVLCAIYGGAVPQEAPIWLQAIKAELKAFANHIIAKGDHAELWAATSKTEGVAWGSFLSNLLQTEERRCMLAMRTHAMNAGWSVDVLAYDGIMLRKREDATLSEDFLVEMAHAVKEATGYAIRILEKPMEGFDMPKPDDSREVDGVPMATYLEMRERFEQNHFYLKATNQICEFNPETGNLLYMDMTHARTALQAEWSFPGKTDLDGKEFLPMWLRDAKRRVVDTIDLAPSDDPRIFSTFNGFAYEKAAAPADAAERVAQFNQLLDALAPEPELRSFLVEWLAHMVQKPFENPLACVVLTGPKRCGKDTLGDLMMAVLGDRYSQNYDSTNQFWDKHDEGRMGKILIKLEEAVGSINRKNEAEFKSRITSRTLTINPKGRAPITTPNYARYLLTTNEAAPIKLDEGERRFVLIPCSGALRNDMAFFGRFNKELIYSPEGRRAIGDWLAAQPIGAFPRGELPQSSLARDAIDADKSVEQRFLESDEWDGKDIKPVDMFNLYRTWCRENELPHALNDKSFGLRMLQHIQEGRCKKRKSNGAILYFR